LKSCTDGIDRGLEGKVANVKSRAHSVSPRRPGRA
jgi:hypothetical protein